MPDILIAAVVAQTDTTQAVVIVLDGGWLVGSAWHSVQSLEGGCEGIDHAITAGLASTPLNISVAIRKWMIMRFTLRL